MENNTINFSNKIEEELRNQELSIMQNLQLSELKAYENAELKQTNIKFKDRKELPTSSEVLKRINDNPISFMDSFKRSLKENLGSDLVAIGVDSFIRSKFKEDDNYDVFNDGDYFKYADKIPLLKQAKSKEELNYMILSYETKKKEDEIFQHDPYALTSSFLAGIVDPVNVISGYTLLPEKIAGKSIVDIFKTQSHIFTINGIVDYKANKYNNKPISDVIDEAFINTIISSGFGALGLVGKSKKIPQDLQNSFIRDNVGIDINNIFEEKELLNTNTIISSKNNLDLDLILGNRELGNINKNESSLYDTIKNNLKNYISDTSGSAKIGFGDFNRMSSEKIELENLNKPIGAFGLEKVPLNPLLRKLSYSTDVDKNIMLELIDLSGLKLNKNKFGIATTKSGLPSVETLARIETNKETFKIVDDIYNNYKSYRDKKIKEFYGDKGLTNLRKINPLGNYGIMQREEFFEEVGRTIINNKFNHEIPEINKVAKNIANVLDEYSQKGLEVGLWQRPFTAKIDRLNKELFKYKDKLKEAVKKNDADSVKTLTKKINTLSKAIKNTENDLNSFEANFSNVNHHGERFFPRIYNLEKISKNRKEFTKELADEIMRASKVSAENGLIEKPLTRKQAYTKADGATEVILKGKLEFIDPEELHASVEDILSENSTAKVRTLDIDTRNLDKWFNRNVDDVLRYYLRTTITDIKLMERFGDISMMEQIKKIEKSYDELIDKASTKKEVQELRFKKKLALDDIRALRDRLRGTFGMAEDPMAPLSRTIRAVKKLNSIMMLGGSALSSIPDAGRIIMTQGLYDSYRYAIKPVFSNIGKEIRKMSLHETNMVGEAVETTLNLRALAFMDTGDTFMAKSHFERSLSNVENISFIISGLNWWNNTMKQITGQVVSFKMLDNIYKLTNGTGIDDKYFTRLASLNIDRKMAMRIRKQVDKYGEIKNVKGTDLRFPNTDKWDDLEALDVYRGAVSNEINTTIVTPGAGDRAVWTSTEFGGMIAQFKSFAQASTQRVLISGMQEGNASFFNGLLMMLVLGHTTNKIKEKQYGMKPRTDLYEQIFNAVDRSGVLGIYQEMYNTGNRLLRPRNSLYRKGIDVVNVGLGPTGSQITNISDLLKNVYNGDEFYKVNLRKMMPSNTNPFLDPLYDAIFKRENIGYRTRLMTKDDGKNN